MTRSTEEVLREALAHLTPLRGYAQGDLQDQLVLDAICMRLSASIEASARLGPHDLDRLFGDEWSEMWGMRNRIAHGYLLVNTAIVRQTVDDDVPRIAAAITADLDEPS